MKKQDWLDYFEAVNGRSPEAHEVEAALLAGEFQEDEATVEQVEIQPEQSQQVSPAEEVATQPVASSQVQQTEQTVAQQASQPQQQQTQQNTQFQQVQEQFAAFQQSEQVQNLKEKTGNYFNWLSASLKNPTNDANNTNFNFSVITLGLSSLFLGGALLNFIRRILLSVANLSVSGETMKKQAPEMYDKIVDFVSDEFGLMKLLTVALAIAVIYLVTVAVPLLMDKLSGETISDYKEAFAKNSYFLPIILVLNVLAFVSSFLVKGELAVSEKSVYSITGLFSYMDDNPMAIIPSFLSTMEDIPALKSIFSSAQYLLILSGLGVLVLLVFLIKKTHTSYKKVNDFYISILGVVVFFLVLVFVNRFISSTIFESFEDLPSLFEGLY